MSLNYGIPSVLLSFLGACVYGDAKLYYAELSEAERAKLEKQIKTFGMSAWLYRYLYDILPKEKQISYQKSYQKWQIKAIMGGQELKRLYCVLSEHGLRFVPIKGADFAYRLYPDAALRTFCDWDIWFHPDDCNRALSVLAEDGWCVPASYSKNHDSMRECGFAHHFSPHFRGQERIEPHFTLANFDGIDPHEMWEHTVELPSGNGQRVLSPEMNLLMIARHAATKSYYHANIPKLLTDAAMLLRENVDFESLRALAAHWHLPYPGDLFAAFPEFFPEEIISSFKADQEKADRFRNLFNLRSRIDDPGHIALMLSKYSAKGHVAGGVLKHIRALRPAKIRLIYNLPEHGTWGRVAWAYICWFYMRSRLAIQWVFQQDRNLKKYGHIVESIESDSNGSANSADVLK